MIQESEVRQQLVAVASGQLPLFDFADSLDSKSWNMHRDSSAETVKLVSSIDRLLAEYDHRDLSEVDLRRELLSLLNNYVSVPVHIEIEVDRVSRMGLPVPSNLSSVQQVPQLWVPELV